MFFHSLPSDYALPCLALPSSAYTCTCTRFDHIHVHVPSVESIINDEPEESAGEEEQGEEKKKRKRRRKGVLTCV